MNILSIHNFYRFRGGEDRYVLLLEEMLKEKGHVVTTFFYDSAHIENYSKLKKYWIPLSLIRGLSVEKKLKRILLEKKPQVAIVHNLSPLISQSIIRFLKKNNIPVLKRLENFKFLCLNGLFMRNDFSACEVCKNGNFLPGIFHRCYQHSLFNSNGLAFSEWIHRKLGTVKKYPDLFLASSRFVKSKFVEAGFPADKIHVYPNILDFEPVEEETPASEYAVYLGRLSFEKGLMTLMSAFKELPHLPLKIIGSGPMETVLKEYVQENGMGHITFEGFVDGPQKKELLKKALFLIFPSECYESFGNTIVEAYACGVPVISVGTGSAEELVDKNETGFLFKKGDYSDLRDTINLALSNREQLSMMRKIVLDRSKQLYTREKGYENLEKVLALLPHTK